jgi:hypothetical protein
VSVLPAIDEHHPSPNEIAGMAQNKFRNEWESWMDKLRGSHFKTHRKSGLYANLGFEVTSVAATALCLAHVSEN